MLAAASALCGVARLALGIHTFLKMTQRAKVALVVLALLGTGASPAGANELTARAGASKIPFVLEAITGERVSLADVEKRVVLVHFFATW